MPTKIYFGPTMPAQAPIAHAVEVVEEFDTVVERIRLAIDGDGLTTFECNGPEMRVCVHAHTVQFILEQPGRS